MRRLVPLAVLLALAACNSPPRTRPRATAAPEVVAPAVPEPTASEEVLPEARTVRFTTSDGVTIVGTLQPAARADAPAVVLVHQLGTDRTEWAPLLERLHATPSFTTLAIDLRGHGESTVGPSGALEWHAFDADAWTLSRNDVRAAVDYLRSAASGVAPSRFVAVGSSIGCSAVIAAAAEEPALTSIVTLSPGRAYHGFDAITPAIALGDREIFAVVARDEADSVDTAQAYARITGTPAMIVDGNAHGVALFALDPQTLDRVAAYVRGGAPPPAPPTPPVVDPSAPR